MFTTQDSFGHDKKIQAKVIDTIEVNMGGGNIESRPVIELDIKFAGEDYKKIPFSVSDRSTNNNPILISKGFVENELEALIDVGAMNISHEGRDVVYGEGFLGSIGNGLKNLKTGTDKFTTRLGAAAKWMKGGDDVNLFAPLGLLGDLWNYTKAIVNSDNLTQSDYELIRGKLPNSILPKNLQQNEIDLSNTIWEKYNEVDFKKTTILPFVSFKGRTGDLKNGHVISGMESRIKNWKSAMKAAQKQTEEQKNKNQKKNSNEEISSEEDEEILLEAELIFEADEQANVQSTSDKDSENQNIEETATDFKQLNNFVLYYIPAFCPEGKNYSPEDVKTVFDNSFSSGKFDSVAIKLFNTGDVTPDSARSVVKTLSQEIQNIASTMGDNSKIYKGSFVLVTGLLNKRTVHLYDNIDEAVCTIPDQAELQTPEEKQKSE